MGLMLFFDSAYLLAQTPTTGNRIHTLAAKEAASTDHGAERTNAGGSRSVILYRRHCIDCHDPDGRSASAREIVSHAPDFTDPGWHRAHGDFELAHVIWEGKKPMPAMKAKLAMRDVDGLVLLVRGFRGGKLEVPEDPGAPGENEDLENAPPPHRSPDLLPPQPPVSPSSVSPGTNSIGGGEAIAPTARTTFQRLCAGCHGASGDGSPLRASTPAIPDFTLRDWQEKRGDAALTVSILEGKGRAMPPFGTQLDKPGAHDLVTYVRSLAGSRSDQSKELPTEFNLQFQQLMAEMETLKRDCRALSDNDRFSTSNPSSSTGSAAFVGSAP
jgi:mono/diheme cytochrome c family protein